MAFMPVVLSALHKVVRALHLMPHIEELKFVHHTPHIYNYNQSTVSRFKSPRVKV